MISTQGSVTQSALAGVKLSSKKLHTSTHMREGSMKLMFDDMKSNLGAKGTKIS